MNVLPPTFRFALKCFLTVSKPGSLSIITLRYGCICPLTATFGFEHVSFCISVGSRVWQPVQRQSSNCGIFLWSDVRKFSIWWTFWYFWKKTCHSVNSIFSNNRWADNFLFKQLYRLCDLPIFPWISSRGLLISYLLTKSMKWNFESTET